MTIHNRTVKERRGGRGEKANYLLHAARLSRRRLSSSTTNATVFSKEKTLCSSHFSRGVNALVLLSISCLPDVFDRKASSSIVRRCSSDGGRAGEDGAVKKAEVASEVEVSEGYTEAW